MEKNVEKKSMSVCTVADFANRLTSAEMLASGAKRAEAEGRVSRRLGLAKSTLWLLRQGRIKNVRELEHKIRSALVAELERTINRLQDELDVARVAGREIDFESVEAHIRIAKEKLENGRPRP
jgi:hypothetical protein